MSNSRAASDTTKEVRRQPTEWEKNCVNYISDKRLLSRALKNSSNLKIERQPN